MICYLNLCVDSEVLIFVLPWYFSIQHSSDNSVVRILSCNLDFLTFSSGPSDNMCLFTAVVCMVFSTCVILRKASLKTAPRLTI